MKGKKKFSIRLGIAAIVLSCWLVPFLLLMGVMGYYIMSDQLGKRVEQEMEQMKFNGQICSERLKNAVAASRDASYDSELREQWKKLDRTAVSKVGNYSVLNQCTSYLTRKYKQDEKFQCTMFWFRYNPHELNTSVYNENAGGSYQKIQEFWNKDQEAVRGYAEELDTYIGFVMREDRMYMVRNLMDGTFNSFGTLVMRLNPDYIFESLLYMGDEDHQMTIRLDNVVLRTEGKNKVELEHGIQMEDYPEGSSWGNGMLRLKDKHKGNGYELTTLVQIPRETLLKPLYGYLYALIGMGVALVPVLLILFWLMKNHITRPVENLMAGAKEVEEGKLGYQLDYQPASQEFQYLVESFNQMSERLKYQFDHIYKEELALRDARIMALQSHINPHFLNNTLEIINWEARLQGNGRISKMIESLSVLMDAAMDRKRLPEVPLAEELQYVDAYLYITKERLGNRLHIEKELPEELMKENVPRLILQPVIENAIVHGVVPYGEGTVTMKGYRKGEFLYLEIYNDGEFTPKEKQKIARLLDPEYNTSKESSGNLGIANVNQRLRILYGEPCGLSIFGNGNGKVCARLTILVGTKAQ